MDCPPHRRITQAFQSMSADPRSDAGAAKRGSTARIGAGANPRLDLKLHHMPAAFARSPLFLLRNAPKMFAHTFRGSTIRSFLGLEDERKAFRRFQAIRRAERAYV
jgi:hypothetical protein